MEEPSKKIQLPFVVDRSELCDTLSFEGDTLFPDPQTFRTGTIPPDCPLIKKDEDHSENHS